ncbi:MAG: AfsR/SARP family transcriptional regulator, partial [Chloroflexota bacterium]
KERMGHAVQTRCGIGEVVARARGAAFAVDESATVVAWNEQVGRGLGRPGAPALGRPCYAAVRAVDARTGQPCHRQCPLVDRSLHAEWVHSRLLRADWEAGPAGLLDCTLLRYVLPSSERGSLVFVTPLDKSDAERHLHAASTIRSLYPTLTTTTDVEAAGRVVLDAALQATDADSGEIILLDPWSGEESRVIGERHGDARTLDYPMARREMLEIVAASECPLVASEPRQQGPAWWLTIPLTAENRFLGALTVASGREAFSPGFAAPVLFALGSQLSVFSRWAWARGPRGQATAPVPPGMSEARLRVHCFGTFKIVLDGQELTRGRFLRQKSVTLLKVLASRRGKPWHREALMELLWPEAGPGLASNNLRVVLHDLRHTLEPDLPRGQASGYVLSRGDMVSLDASDRSWCDVEAFAALAKRFDALLARRDVEGAVAAGRAACALYSADYLEDDPYVDWFIEERERLREVYVNIQQRLASIYAERNDLEEALAACRMALAADPMREETRRQLMELLSRGGRAAEALRQYQACRRMLRTELGVEPSEATRRVRDRIASAMAAPTSSSLTE